MINKEIRKSCEVVMALNNLNLDKIFIMCLAGQSFATEGFFM